MGDMTNREYWNKVGRVIRTDPGSKRFSDNFQKRRVLFEALLKYDLSGAKIFELGPGLGYTAYTICGVNPPCSYAGLDVSDKMAEYADTLFGMKVYVGDATKLPFKDDSFDVFFAFDTLEHISAEKKPKLYSELDRILCKKNRIIFINNPLSESRHDDEFEHGFSRKDLYELMETTNTELLEVKLLAAHRSRYQFIVLGSLERGQ